MILYHGKRCLARIPIMCGLVMVDFHTVVCDNFHMPIPADFLSRHEGVVSRTTYFVRVRLWYVLRLFPHCRFSANASRKGKQKLCVSSLKSVGTHIVSLNCFCRLLDLLQWVQKRGWQMRIWRKHPLPQ